MIEYTDNQILAKKYEGKNILVSASAGSGKTGVLKERVIRKINDKVDIDKLIILTFTEAAAYEMKSRIIKEIHKNELFDQIPKLDNAIISTFDAFCLRLVKEYHYLLDVENTITIADSVLIKSKKQAVIKEILKRYYEENSKQFNQTFKRYFSKSDAWLYNAVYRLGEDFRKNPSYQEILENYRKTYLTEEFIEDKANEYLDSLLNEIKAEYEIFANDFLKNLALSDEVYSSYISEVNLIINDLLNSSQDEFIKKLIAISFPRKKGPKELPKPPIIEKIQKLAKEVNELFAIDLLTLKDSFYSSQEAVNVLLEITAKYLSEFEVVKKEENLYSFEDIMFLAIKLFEDNPKIAKKYQDNINEILIDEYQDTNDLQDRFIALISNNNTFMVGDIKQSIYRFRNANPKNFLRIYEDYLSSDNGKAIFLQENFRSNGFVLEEINKIFKNLMTKNRGGIDYKDQQVLKSGYKKNHPVHDENALDIKLYDLTDLEDDEEEVSKAQAEAHIIAKDIKRRIENKEKIYDLKNETFRELSYQDITILAAQKSDFNTYVKIISDYNIPLDVYNDEPFFSSEEILFMFQYLLLINSFIDEDYFKKYFKSSFYSVARSFVYRIKDQVLSRFFAFEKIDSIADLMKLKDYEELKVIYDDILSITAKCWDLPPSVILEEVYDKLHIYRKIADLKNPREKEEKLDFFLLKLESFSFFTFSDLIKYLELIIETNEFDIEYSKEKKSVNAIKIMSMHKAKGLEFGICYLAGLYKRFQNPDKREPFIFSKEYGILTKAYNDGFYENFLRKLYFKKDDEEDLSERIRLLYVAMTRAINKLVIVMDYDEELLTESKALTSFKNILYRYLNLNEITPEVIDLTVEVDRKISLKKTDKLIERKNFKFNKEILEKVTYSKTVDQVLSDEIKAAIKAGDEYHHLLETIDFNNFTESIKEFPNFLKESLNYFINSEIIKNLIEPIFYQEYEFYQIKDEVVYRGVIDLLIIDKDKVYAIDYKLKNIDDLAYEKQLKGYYDYLSDKLDKPIKLFLYSLSNKVLKEINL